MNTRALLLALNANIPTETEVIKDVGKVTKPIHKDASNVLSAMNKDFNHVVDVQAGALNNMVDKGASTLSTLSMPLFIVGAGVLIYMVTKK